MVAPVTGPFTSFPTEPFADNYRRGYRQKMPVDRPLEYRMYRYYGSSYTVSWLNSNEVSNPPSKEANFSISSDPSYATRRQAAYNLAYERLRNMAMDTAGWAENLAQINKSRQMINDRAAQLGRFVMALRKGRFNVAARTLRTARPSGVSHGKALAQNFLEFEYGVKPLIKDIQESCKVLTGDPFDRPIRSQASDRITKLVRASGSFGSNPVYSYVQRDATTGTLQLRLRATMRVTSPNLLLANQLGFIDLALPWKLVPFSFVVDWFVNVEQVISSFTDWYGVTLLDPHVSEFRKGQLSQYYWQNASYTSGSNEGFRTIKDKDSVEFDRTMGIPGPSLVMKPFKGFSLERGLQAISLVLSVFGK